MPPRTAVRSEPPGELPGWLRADARHAAASQRDGLRGPHRRAGVHALWRLLDRPVGGSAVCNLHLARGARRMQAPYKPLLSLLSSDKAKPSSPTTF
eukprot:358066-Chlamydomonas_euryale.AAC.3